MPRNDKGFENGPLVAWYGDDFTGAAAVMEVLSFAGLPSLLFLAPPTQAQLAQFPDLKGIGVASTARALSPGEMDEQLPPVFTDLKALNPAIMHYKVCSTLDSAPQIGSIGRAIEIGADCFASTQVPILIAAPQMRRYQCFGHLFAGMGDAVYRLDEHPVMSRHPVTPMDDSNVARHIAKQSDRLDISCLTRDQMMAQNAATQPQPSDTGRISAITLDSTDADSETAAGRFIWEGRAQSPFVVGSQGVEYALARHWIEMGLIDPQQAPGTIGRADKMVVVSGSVSPTTAEQIAWSKNNGFAAIPFDPTCVCQDRAAIDRAIQSTVDAALLALQSGQDPLIHTAEGPDDPAVTRLQQAVAASDIAMSQANQSIGEALGQILHQILTRSGTRRAVVSGGDTSGHATRQLGIYALSALSPTIPGAAILKAHAEGPMDGLELALKGGQMGSPDYFGWVKEGGGAR